MGQRRLRVIDRTGGACVATALVADTALTRMKGLLGRSELTAGDGLVLDPCASIHTCFMRFPIDVAFIRRDGTIVRQVESLLPFRLAWAPGSALAVELPAGTLRTHGVRAGHCLELEPL